MNMKIRISSLGLLQQSKMISSADHHDLSVVCQAQASLGLRSFENMFCAPVRPRVDAINGICIFFAYLLHFYYTNSESEQNYTIYIFLSIHFF